MQPQGSIEPFKVFDSQASKLLSQCATLRFHQTVASTHLVRFLASLEEAPMEAVNLFGSPLTWFIDHMEMSRHGCEHHINK
jgi:hypothetical protein